MIGPGVFNIEVRPAMDALTQVLITLQIVTQAILAFSIKFIMLQEFISITQNTQIRLITLPVEIITYYITLILAAGEQLYL